MARRPSQPQPARKAATRRGVSRGASSSTALLKVEEALRRSQAELSFVLELSDAVRQLDDPIEIQATAARLLGERLQADRVFYGEIVVDHGVETCVVERDYHRPGLSSLTGRFPFREFSHTDYDEYRAGRTVCSSNIFTDERDPGQREAYRAVGVAAYIGVPLVKREGPVSVLGVLQGQPRSWRPEEIRLAEQSVDRTWQAVQRVRAEKALRESEELLRAVTDSSPDAIYVKDRSSRWLMANPAVLRIVGRTADDALGKTDLELYADPAIGRAILENDRRILEQGRTDAFEEVADTPDGRRTFVSVKAPRRDGRGTVVGLIGISRDVTERKRAEEALREVNATLEARVQERTGQLGAERQRLFDVLDTLPAMICLLTPDHRVLFANRAFRDRYGGTRGRHCFEQCYGLQAPCPFCESFKPLETGEPHHWEVTTPDGASVIAAHAYPFTDTDGSRLVLEMDLDITAQRRDEAALEQLQETLEARVVERTEQLRESEERYRGLFENLNSAVLLAEPILDRDGRLVDLTCVMANPAVGRHLNLAPTDLVGRRYSEVFSYSGRNPVFDLYERVLTTGESYNGELFLPALDRHYDVAAYRPAPGQLALVLSDITARKQAEAAVQEERDRLSALVNSITDEIWFADADRKVTLVNPAAWREFGVGMGDDRDIRTIAASFEVYRPDGSLRPVDEAPPLRALQGETVIGQEEIVRTPAAGQLRHRQVNAAPVHNAGGAIIGSVSVVRDITARKRAEEALTQANFALAEADRRKNEFLAILSHELRNPLAPVRYALPLLAEEPLGPAGRRATQVIDRQVAHLTRLVDDLLDVSRITAGKVELRRDHVTLAAVVTAAVEAASPAMAVGRHSLDIAVPDDPVWLHVDAARVSQAITNLLNNSAKYTPQGGRVRLEATTSDGLAVIRVIDNGIGIAPEALTMVFEMFRQVGGPNRTQSGLGVGLALAKQFVEMHGGTIEAHSSGENTGAEFVVRLPLASGAIARTERLAPGALERPARLRVLVVDDNVDLVEMLAMVVESDGHGVRKAFDGRSAISAALEYQPHVILLDVGLPDMNGIEVAKELRRHAEVSAARIVALTGWGQPDDRRRTEEAGFDDHLTKPTDPPDIQRILTEVASRIAASGRV